MTGEELKAITHLLFGDSHNWGCQEAADWLGVNPRTVRRWASNEAPIPPGVQLSLRKELAFDLVRRAYRTDAPFLKVVSDALKALEDRRFILTPDADGRAQLVVNPGTVDA